MEDCLSLSRGVLCMHGVAGQDPFRKPCWFAYSIPVGVALEVVPVGCNDGLLLCIIA